ncbi:hypothetical protein BDY19DRAFT_996856 [Irpex rosettiformis]|uniref:Uncharacterized protein n=1 Tax=Irpex rosettiformis TaxID=378272 RepID=A0ACB8TTJ0_9APHY|nr:hypothetical protein BDY19DRAFT_996856 [Irpex rosettiformis]
MLVWITEGSEGAIAGNVVGTTGVDLIREAGGGLVAVTLDYRLDVFGFLPGAQVKQKGALNAGLNGTTGSTNYPPVDPFVWRSSSEVTIWGESAGTDLFLMGARKP